MGFFRNLFGKKKSDTWDDLMKDIKKAGENYENEKMKEVTERHKAAAAQGMLPPPNISVSYECECGSTNSFNMINLNLASGLDVQCFKCGAILHVPPTVLDHGEYWADVGGASLVQNWRDQMKITRHGNR